MTNKKRTKPCLHCDCTIIERYGDSNSQWEERNYCSLSCSASSLKRVTDIFTRLARYQVKKDGCWEWSSSKDGGGYGTLSNRNGRKFSPEKAHRVSYELMFGIIPKGMVIRHKCDNPECTNPEHLEIGSQKDNANDMVSRGRMNPKSLDNLDHERSLTINQVKEIKLIKFVGKNGRGNGRRRIDVATEYGVCVDIIRSILKGNYDGK